MRTPFIVLSPAGRKPVSHPFQQKSMIERTSHRLLRSKLWSNSLHKSWSATRLQPSGAQCYSQLAWGAVSMSGALTLQTQHFNRQRPIVCMHLATTAPLSCSVHRCFPAAFTSGNRANKSRYHSEKLGSGITLRAMTVIQLQEFCLQECQEPKSSALS